MLNYKNNTMENEVIKAGQTFSSANKAVIQRCIDDLSALIAEPSNDTTPAKSVDNDELKTQLETLINEKKELELKIVEVETQKNDIEKKLNNLLKQRVY